ncbi:MAG: glycosyltransferase family 2 protein [Clostridia bacterium]|nr:glycosyltransferase family 2 protein [Clostridia bacterium]
MEEIIGKIFIYLGVVIGILFVLCYFHTNIYMIITLLFNPETKKAKKNHRYGFIICARNEEAVIGNLISSIKAQDYPQELINIYVMADNCIDNTATCARMAGATKVFERFNKEKVGKGYALEALFDELLKDEEAMKCEGFFVFDADNTLNKNYTARMNDVFDNGARIATGYRCASNFKDGFIATANGYYFMRDCFVMHRARTIIGASTMVTGTGWLMSSDIIKKENGWHYVCLAEDSEFITEQVLKGEKSVYCHDAIFYDEQPITFSQSWKQRKRWLKGTVQVTNRYFKELLKGIFKSENRFTCYDFFVSAVSYVYLTAIGGIVGIASCIFNMLTASSVLQAILIALGYLGGLYSAFIFMALVPVLGCWKRVPLSAGKKILYLLMFPAFVATYIPLAVIALFSKDVKWEPIAHGVKNNKTASM